MIRMPILRIAYGFHGAVVGLHLVYFLLALHYGHIYNGDSFEYIHEAINIKDHFFFYSGNPALPITEEYMTLRPPGYPLFLLLTYIWGINNWMVLAWQSAISVLNIFLCRNTFMLLGYDKKYDGWLFLCLLFYPSQLIYAHLMAPDILLQTFTLLYIRYMVLFLLKKDSRYVWWMSLALIGGLFMKPVLYPYAFIHFPLIAILSLRQKTMTHTFAALLPLLCIVAYSLVNKARTGKYHFSSIQSFNAIYYYQRYYTDKVSKEKGQTYIQLERAAIVALPTFAQRYDKANERGIEILKENFFSYMPYHLGKSVLFFLETGRGELEEFTGRLTLRSIYAGEARKFSTVLRESSWKELGAYIKVNITVVIALITLLTNVLKLIGLFLFARYASVPSLVKWFLFLFFAYFALLTGPISNAHYVMPVSLAIMCGGITGYIVTFKRRTYLAH